MPLYSFNDNLGDVIEFSFSLNPGGGGTWDFGAGGDVGPNGQKSPRYIFTKPAKCMSTIIPLVYRISQMLSQLQFSIKPQLIQRSFRLGFPALVLPPFGAGLRV